MCSARCVDNEQCKRSTTSCLLARGWLRVAITTTRATCKGCVSRVTRRRRGRSNDPRLRSAAPHSSVCSRRRSDSLSLMCLQPVQRSGTCIDKIRKRFRALYRGCFREPSQNATSIAYSQHGLEPSQPNCGSISRTQDVRQVGSPIEVAHSRGKENLAYVATLSSRSAWRERPDIDGNHLSAQGQVGEADAYRS